MTLRSITLQTSDNDIITDDKLGSVSFAASNESDGSTSVLIGAAIDAVAEGNFTNANNPTAIVFSTATNSTATGKLKITNSGHFVPLANNIYDIGSSSLVFRSGYFNNLSINGSPFNNAVSGLLPTINNSGDNRILTSNGSSIGINAENNLTFDGSLLNINGNIIANSGTFNTIYSTGSIGNETGTSQLYLNNSSGNRIDFNGSGIGPPNFTTNRSLGTKIVLSPNISSTQTEFALGMEAGAMWFSVPVAASRAFKWYAGTANIATLFGNGTLNIDGSTSQINVDSLRLDNNVLSTTTSDSDLILRPNGDGSLLTDTSGNPRGIYSNDFQRVRTSVSGVAAGSYSVICGGSDNRTANSYSTIGGGQTNVASNVLSTVCGGDLNTASGNRSTVCGGGSNTSSAQSSTVGGGSNNQAGGTYSTVPGGLRAKATRHGELSHAAGFFNAVGDAQHTILVARRLTSDNTENALTLNGSVPDVSTNLLVLPARTSWTFTIQISAYNNNDNTAAGWNIRGCIRRNASNITSMVGSNIVESWSESTMSNCVVSVTADDTNEALQINVTGLTGKNIRWVATVDISQVSYGTP